MMGNLSDRLTLYFDSPIIGVHFIYSPLSVVNLFGVCELI
ncbi:hypothetical protein BGS_1382 [Beggiatoa sp. SS]|nr:hypothetical protein BGS_1382 [Beggiatoa sp. SS]